MSTFDWNKAFPWILAAGVAIAALIFFKGNNTIAPPTVWPTPTVHPFDPTCPDCYPKGSAEYVALNRLNRLEESFKNERSAMRREMLRTQLNVAQAARDLGRTQPMKIPGWLYYQTYDGGMIGSEDYKGMTIDAAPTDFGPSTTPPAGK